MSKYWRCNSLLVAFCLAASLAPSPTRAQPDALPATVAPDRPAATMPVPSLPPQAILQAPASGPDPAADFALPMPIPAMAAGPGTGWPEAWTWQIVPEGLMYRAYLAGRRESRFASEWVHAPGQGWLWDVAIGGHVGVLRYGTQDPLFPEGWQIDIEGAAFPQLDMDRNLISSEFRCGIPLTTRFGPWEGKFAFYHLSSHLADEFMLSHHDFDRINYSRDVLVLGFAFHPDPDWRLYAETGWAFHTDGGSRPWEFQFGVEFSPARPTGFRGAPFLAINARLRQEVDFGGNFTTEAGWQWRGQTGHLARFGLVYFNGKADEYQFFRRFEEQIGVGLWYDY